MSSWSLERDAPDTSNYQKYQTRNRLMLSVIRRFVNRIGETVGEWRPARILDLGCGEGIVAQRLRELPFEFDYLGIDINPESVHAARQLNPGLAFDQADILEYPVEEGWADLVLCLEVVEHMSEPDRAVELVRRWTRNHALVSVPWEPYFRLGNLLRGRHVTRLGNHPEHVQQFRPVTLARLLERRFPEVRVERCFPWLIGRCGTAGDPAS